MSSDDIILKFYGSNNVRVLAGARGLQGSVGTDGPTGNTGAAGIAGLTGNTGGTGNTGAVSPTGYTGETGNTGPTADTITYGRTDRSTILVPCYKNGIVKGYDECDTTLRIYQNGTQVDVSGLTTITIDTLNCSVGQTAEVIGNGYGVVFNVTNLAATAGKFLINTPYGGQTLQNTVYVLKSYDGSIGSTGITGFTGFTGKTGGTGIDGTTGGMGITGYTGQTGANGAVGAVGAAGNTGGTGATGVAGFVKISSITLSEASLKAGIDTGYVLVIAKGGTLNIPVFIKVKNNIGSSPFDFGGALLRFKYTTGGGDIITFSNGFLESSSNRTDFKYPSGGYEDAYVGSSIRVYADNVAGTGVGGEIICEAYYIESE